MLSPKPPAGLYIHSYQNSFRNSAVLDADEQSDGGLERPGKADGKILQICAEKEAKLKMGVLIVCENSERRLS